MHKHMMSLWGTFHKKTKNGVRVELMEEKKGKYISERRITYKHPRGPEGPSVLVSMMSFVLSNDQMKWLAEIIVPIC